MKGMGCIVILAICDNRLIRVHENLVQHPSINISILLNYSDLWLKSVVYMFQLWFVNIWMSKKYVSFIACLNYQHEFFAILIYYYNIGEKIKKRMLLVKNIVIFVKFINLVAVYSALAKWGKMSLLLAYIFYWRQEIPYTPSLFQGVSLPLPFLFPSTLTSIE